MVCFSFSDEHAFSLAILTTTETTMRALQQYIIMCLVQILSERWFI